MVKKYKRPEIEVIDLEIEDIITASTGVGNGEEEELPGWED